MSIAAFTASRCARHQRSANHGALDFIWLQEVLVTPSADGFAITLGGYAHYEVILVY